MKIALVFNGYAFFFSMQEEALNHLKKYLKTRLNFNILS